MKPSKCQLIEQGRVPGSCLVEADGKRQPACQGTLKYEKEALYRLIKTQTNLWVLIETNGYGLTPQNLDRLHASGVDAFWLDIKAHDNEKHKWLTGCSNHAYPISTGSKDYAGFACA